MRRRQFLTGLAGAGFAGMAGPGQLSPSKGCACAMLPVQNALGAEAFRGVASGYDNR